MESVGPTPQDVSTPTASVENPMEKETMLQILQALATHKRQLESAYDDMFDKLYPGLREQIRRITEYVGCATMVTMEGRTVASVESRENGDIAIQFTNGKTIMASAGKFGGVALAPEENLQRAKALVDGLQTKQRPETKR